MVLKVPDPTRSAKENYLLTYCVDSTTQRRNNMVPSLLLAVAAVFWQQCVAQSWQSRDTVVALYPNVCMLCPEATFLRARGRTTIYACVQGRPVPLESWAACESYGTRCLLETDLLKPELCLPAAFKTFYLERDGQGSASWLRRQQKAPAPTRAATAQLRLF